MVRSLADRTFQLSAELEAVGAGPLLALVDVGDRHRALLRGDKVDHLLTARWHIPIISFFLKFQERLRLSFSFISPLSFKILFVLNMIFLS